MRNSSTSLGEASREGDRRKLIANIVAGLTGLLVPGLATLFALLPH